MRWITAVLAFFAVLTAEATAQDPAGDIAQDIAQNLADNLAEDANAPVGEIERRARFLGPAAQYGGGRHVIVLIPRAAPGAARATGEALAQRHQATLEASWPLVSLGETCFVLRVADDADPALVSEQLEAEEVVLLAYPIQQFVVRQSRPFTDPLLPVQDALRAMRVDAAQGIATGEGVRIALIDTGVALDHPDIATLDAPWFDFVDGDEGRLAPERHGTALASVIAARGDGVGMVGVAPKATLLALRACFEDADGMGGCNTFSLALALDHAVQEGANIVNLSLGGPADPVLAALVRKAQEAGALVVGAAGDADFPTSLPDVLAVSDGASPDGSLNAPGVEIVGAEPSGAYDVFSGASVAAAHVSGLAALAWSSLPDASASAIRHALSDGEADACRALTLLNPAVACPD